MRIILDIQGVQNLSRDRGIGRYVLSFAKALYRHREKHDIIFLISNLFSSNEIDIINLFQNNCLNVQHVITYHGVGPTHEFDREYKEQLEISELLYQDFIKSLNPDIFISGSVIEGSEDNTITFTPNICDKFVTCGILYDLIPLTDIPQYLPDEHLRHWYFRQTSKLVACDLKLAISDFSRNDAIERLKIDPKTIVNISAAASDDFTYFDNGTLSPTALSTIKDKYSIKRPFMLHASAFDERKNFRGLIKAFARIPVALRKAHQLVLVCKINDLQRDAISNLFVKLNLSSDEIIFTGFVPDSELAILYSAAKMFIFPSLYEGFGLPALEAMCCGTATIGSNLTSVPEVIGMPDALFDPTSTEHMSALIMKALTDQEFHRSLQDHAKHQARKFSWDTTAKIAIEAMEHAYSRKKQRLAPRTLKATFDSQLSMLHYRGRLPEDLLRHVALSYSRNVTESRRVNAIAGCKKMKWRIEGPFDSTYSLALLNRETARALDALGHEVALHSTEGPGDFDADPYYLSRNPDLMRMHKNAKNVSQQDSDVVSRNLYPPRVNDMLGPINALHHYAWEESSFPPDWVKSFNKNLSYMTCLSHHVARVMIDSGVSIPLAVSGCGVDHWERIIPADNFRVPGKKFRFLNVSSCFPRKGMDALLSAYGAAFSESDDVSLIIKSFDNPHNDIRSVIEQYMSTNVNYPDVILITDDLSDGALKALYKACDVMVCPTKAEGYGLPMAEALLSGIPVIATAWSGHLEFCNESNSWLVDYDFERAQTHFNVYGSVWAHIKVDDLAKALVKAHKSSPQLRELMAKNGRGQLMANHKWVDSAAKLVGAARTLPNKTISRQKARLGWVTTWNVKCGIASYSDNILNQIKNEKFVFANFDHCQLSIDKQNVARCWYVSKYWNSLSNIFDIVIQKSIQAVVIQFNYGFYNHDELSALIHTLFDSKIVIILVLHSTVDPTGIIADSELWRISETLKLCDRLLVHSVNDLNRLKSIGVTNNVTLFPLGIRVSDISKNIALKNTGIPVVVSYGYALPHKGLLELVKAAGKLRDNGNPIHLKMINASYSDQWSGDLISEINKEIKRQKLGNLVETNFNYLSTHESDTLLQSADLIVFPYQETAESASAAVREGLASGKPVAVTPLSIFDDLDDAVFRLGGTSVTDLAVGIEKILFEINMASKKAHLVAQEAQQWIAQHDYAWLGERLGNMIDALVEAKENV